MSAIEMTTVVNASQSGKQSEVEISLDGTTVSASEGELLVGAILRHKELPHICYHSDSGDELFPAGRNNIPFSMFRVGGAKFVDRPSSNLLSDLQMNMTGFRLMCKVSREERRRDECCLHPPAVGVQLLCRQN
jgi:hypothetical protein